MMQPVHQTRRRVWKRPESIRLSSHGLAWVGWAATTIGLGSCGVGIVSTDDDKECTASRCTEFAKDCGEIFVVGCGVVQCGDCRAPETCGAGGEANVCGAETCNPSWRCELPWNGYEEDGCGGRRPNPDCDAPSRCGNGVKDTGEACDWQGNVGCNDPRPVCDKNCRGCTQNSGTLLWDGSFHGNEHRVDKNTLFSDGQYKQTTCLAQADSFDIVPASALPGGRKGYAAKFFDGVGSAYECNSNRHNQILGKIPDHPGPSGIRDVWYGWSQYLEPPWSPSGGSLGTVSVGMALVVNGFTVSGKGIGMANHPDSWIFEVNAAGEENPNILNEDLSGNWNDWMYHVKWARDDTGLLEVWLKRPGQAGYSKVYSKYGFRTEYPQPGIPPEKLTVGVALGQYGHLSARNPQTIYILSPKMGTTRADVEYLE